MPETFAEWLTAWPYAVTSTDAHRPAIAVPDCGLESCDALRRAAFHLTDYRLTSVVAGSLWFMPRGADNA